MLLVQRELKKGLNKMDGISANVNLALEKATIEFNPSAISATDIIQKVEKLGMVPFQKEENEERSCRLSRKSDSKTKWKFIFSAILSFPFFGRWLAIFHLHPLFTYQMIYESMGTNGFSNTCSIYYWKTVLCWCL